MKILDIAKTIGAGLIRESIPGGGLLLDVVNGLLPEDKRLPATATGKDVQIAMGGLPPQDRAKLMAMEFDVDITQVRESNDTLRTMLESDASSPHTTRPYIAKGAFQVIAACSLAVIFTWCGGVWRSDAGIVTAAQDGAQFMLFVLGPLVTLLWAYFGVLKTEQRDRLNAASGGAASSPSAGLITGLFKGG